MSDTQEIGFAVGTLGGDRLCAGCGFNLIGQRIAREPAYGLLIATCPECGMVASMQSYPLMTRWVHRWRALLAAAWVLFLAGVFSLQVWLLVTGSARLSGDVGVPLARTVGEAYDDWLVANEMPSNKASWGANQTMYYQWVAVTPEWLGAEGQVLLDAEDSFSLFLRWDAMLLMVPDMLLSVVMGVFWSVLLLGSTRRRVILVPVLIAAGAFVFLLGQREVAVTNYQATEVARRHLHAATMAVLICVCTPFVLLGIWKGRAIMRAVLMMTLPPRLRGPFAWLWLRDGLDPPKARAW